MVPTEPENQGLSNDISDICEMLQERSLWHVKDQFPMLKTIVPYNNQVNSIR